MRPMARLAAMLALLVLCGLALSACNTIEGAGEDLEEAGDAISDSARDARD